MRDCENIQVQLYLHALGFHSGFLVEGFSKATKGKSGKTELVLYTHEVAYDASYVSEIILGRLVGFTKYFADLMQSRERKECILKADVSEWTKYLEEYLEIPQLDF